MDLNIQKIRARLIANTKRKGASRVDNLYEVATLIEQLQKHFGSLKKVSEEVVDISPDMLKRFLSALKVDKRIVPLIKERKIDNINVLFYIQNLEPNNQVFLANLVAEGRINSSDIRAITPLIHKFPNKNISEIVSQVYESKDKKRYLVKFDLAKSSIPSIEKKLKKVLSTTDFQIEKNKTIGTIIFSEFGYNKIKTYTKENNVSYKEYLKSIIED